MATKKKEDTPLKKVTYTEERLAKLGISPEQNNIKLRENDPTNPKEDKLVDTPVFQDVPEGMRIIVYDLDRLQVTYTNKKTVIKESGHEVQVDGSRFKKPFCMTRLREPEIKDGDVVKYLIPKGAGTHPFFPPHLVEKYENADQIHTLFLVEGYIKAFKAAMHGADIIGLSSITHMKETGKNTLHPEILKLMTRCNVQRMVWLTDGDCLDITSKELTDTLDLYKRPNQFFNTVVTFKTLLQDYVDIEKWFFHIDTEVVFNDARQKKEKVNREDLKGIDDLLCTYPDRIADIIHDLNTVSGNSYFFQKFNITYSTSKAYQHFHLSNPKDFYLFHVDRRAELKDKEFIFNGTRYIYDSQSGECKVKIPKETKDYFRVGDHYYKHIMVPNQHGKLEKQIQERKKTTIEDDHGKGFCKNVPKYEAFCNIPDHVNFQQVINGCYNVYSPLDFKPEDEPCTEEDCPNIIGFLRHIFGEKKVTYKNGNGDHKEYTTLELALDYFQMLYQFPQQKLPILCLVSRENETGKSTVANLLRIMLGANTAIVGNADISNDFNAHWASKSVVICDESKIDKLHVMEKIKMLSTAGKIFMNAKGRGQVELDCFIKFILISNHEDNFITISEDDIRYWIIKVPVIARKNPMLLEMFVEEIPAFLSFLSRRKVKTEHENRMWFHPQLLKTQQLQKVIMQSAPSLEKELRHQLKELFLDTGLKEILMTANAVHKEFFKSSQKYDNLYISRILKDKMNVDQFHKFVVEGIENKNYDTHAEAFAAAEIKWHGKDVMIEGKVSKQYKNARHSYPRYEEVMHEGRKEFKRQDVYDNGRPYVFKRENFVSEEENRTVQASQEDDYIANMTAPVMPANQPNADSNELPF